MRYNNSYKHFNNMSWVDPNCNDINQLEYRLRYKKSCVNDIDMLMMATIISNYRALVNKTIKDREYVVRELKK